jgi:hypothetical protein
VPIGGGGGGSTNFLLADDGVTILTNDSGVRLLAQ